MSLLEHFDRLNNHEHTELAITQSKPPPFKAGTQLVPVDQYFLEASTNATDIGQSRLAYDRTTGETLSATLYSHGVFHSKAHLLLAGIRGVCCVRDIKNVSEGVLVFSEQTYGDLHRYLREKKRLSEAQAAPLFRQIVEMVADAHHRHIALRDIKLKKFVFTNKSR